MGFTLPLPNSYIIQGKQIPVHCSPVCQEDMTITVLSDHKTFISQFGIPNTIPSHFSSQAPTFGVERDEAVTRWPVFHRFIKDHVFSEDDNG